MAKHNHPEGACPFVEVMEVVGGKWRGTIIYCLAERPKRFNELRNEMAPVTQKMLAQELRALERDGLVLREQYPQIPPKVVYSLTELGETLKPIINLIDQWKTENLVSVIQAQTRYDKTMNPQPGQGS